LSWSSFVGALPGLAVIPTGVLQLGLTSTVVSATWAPGSLNAGLPAALFLQVSLPVALVKARVPWYRWISPTLPGGS
jgi:hypothetical protein